MNFASDNILGVDERIMAALEAANCGTAHAYGEDDWSQRAEARLSAVFETEVKAFLMTSGTAANALALSALSPPYGAIFCHEEAHIAKTECNAPEFFTHGAKILSLPGFAGKLQPPIIREQIDCFTTGVHDPKPAALSITNVTEVGTLYQPDEIKALSQLAREQAMYVHLDGARFANAVAASGHQPAALTWQAGVDVMSLGGTKNGAMMLEAVIFFNKELAQGFDRLRMRGGQLLSKGRFLGAQMLCYLENNLWLENATHANNCAKLLAEEVAQVTGIRLAYPTNANAVFLIMPKNMRHALAKEGYEFYEWHTKEQRKNMAEHEIMVRFVTGFNTKPEAVAQLVSRLKYLT